MDFSLLSNIISFCTHFCVGVVGVPSCTEGFLSTQVPHDKVDVFPHYFLYIRTNRRRGVHHFIHEKLVQNGGFARIVQANNAYFVFCKERGGQRDDDRNVATYMIITVLLVSCGHFRILAFRPYYTTYGCWMGMLLFPILQSNIGIRYISFINEPFSYIRVLHILCLFPCTIIVVHVLEIVQVIMATKQIRCLRFLTF